MTKGKQLNLNENNAKYQIRKHNRKALRGTKNRIYTKNSGIALHIELQFKVTSNKLKIKKLPYILGQNLRIDYVIFSIFNPNNLEEFCLPE